MPNVSTSLLSFVKSCHQEKEKKIVLCLKIISKKKKKEKNNDDVIKFLIFFPKFDILTKFEDNWTTRTAVSVGVAILPPPSEIAPSK